MWLLGPFSTGLFVTPEIGARLSEPLVTVVVLRPRSASETEALQTLLVACPRYQKRHNSDAPQLAIHWRFWCFNERVLLTSNTLVFVALRKRSWKRAVTVLYCRTVRHSCQMRKGSLFYGASTAFQFQTRFEINPLKSNMNLNCMWRFRSYRTVNALHPVTKSIQVQGSRKVIAVVLRSL